MNLKLGQKLSNFTLPDSEGKLHTLSETAGQWVFVYFYPKDNTSGCTTQACTIRDNFSVIENQEALKESRDNS